MQYNLYYLAISLISVISALQTTNNVTLQNNTETQNKTKALILGSVIVALEFGTFGAVAYFYGEQIFEYLNGKKARLLERERKIEIRSEECRKVAQ